MSRFSELLSCLESMSAPDTLFTLNVYNNFASEPLHKFSLGIARILRTCIYIYVTADKHKKYSTRPLSVQRFASQMRTYIHRTCNSLLATVQSRCTVP